MNVFGTLLAVAFFVMIMHSAYIHLMRPVIIFALRRKLVALRDDLRVRALTGKIPRDDHGFRVLDAQLGRACNEEIFISVSMVLLYRLDPADELQSQQNRIVLENSDLSVREIWEEARLITIASLIANSPMWWFLLPGVLVLAPLSVKAKRISTRIFCNSSDGKGANGFGGACPA